MVFELKKPMWGSDDPIAVAVGKSAIEWLLEQLGEHRLERSGKTVTMLRAALHL